MTAANIKVRILGIITETLPDLLADDANLGHTMEYVREVASSYNTGLLPPPVAQDCPLYTIWPLDMIVGTHSRRFDSTLKNLY